MDPFSVFQVVGAAVSLTEVVVKSLVKLNSIRTRYHKCPLLLSTMIGQLYIVKSALDRLSTWNSSEQAHDPRYEQLSMQIGNSLDSFSTLVLALHRKLDRFEAKSSMEMSAKQKIKLLWNEEDMTEYSILLDRQVNALNLLLQALECSSWLQQDALVSESDNQEVLRVAQGCSSSIFGLDSDSRSISSECTELISISFDFDAVILGSSVYQRAERSHLRQAIRGLETWPLKSPFTERGSSPPGSDSNVLKANYNDTDWRYSSRPVRKSIHWQLRSPPRPPPTARNVPPIARKYDMNVIPLKPVEPGPRVQRVMIAGISENGKPALHKYVVLDREEFSDRFRILLTDVIRDNLIDGTCKVLRHMQRSNIPFNDNYLESQASKDITENSMWLIDYLWENPGFLEAYRQRPAYHLNEGYAYFVHHADRIMAHGYNPSDRDLIYASIRTIDTQDTTYPVLDTGGTYSKRKQWIHPMEHVDTVIMTVDVTIYANDSIEDGDSSQLQEGLEVFRCFLNSCEFENSNFILLFTKGDLFVEWLRIAPPEWFIRGDLQGVGYSGEKSSVVPGEEFIHHLEQRFMEVIESETCRRRVRVIRSGLVDVTVLNPVRNVFKILDSLARKGTVYSGKS